MILLLLSGGIGSPPLVDPDDQTKYYRQYLDDPKVLIATVALPSIISGPISEDAAYYRRHLDDI
jgi:hypothetical protein